MAPFVALFSLQCPNFALRWLLVAKRSFTAPIPVAAALRSKEVKLATVNFQGLGGGFSAPGLPFQVQVIGER
jgi:hypothetical protein